MMQLANASPAQQRAEEQVQTGGQTAVPHTGAPLTAGSLAAASFAEYPPEARALATRYLPLLRTLPMPLLPLLLREMAGFDYRFPRERARILSQLDALQVAGPAGRQATLSGFRALQLPASLDALNWVQDPGGYLESLSAALWSSGQMPQFREAARAFAEAYPDPKQVAGPTPRAAFLVLDDSLVGTPLFQRLRQRGVSLHVHDPNGFAVLLQHVRERACAAPADYAHWYIDGAALRNVTPAADQPNASQPCPALTQVSYQALATVRASLLARARNVMDAERSGPEELRSLLAQTTPEQIGMDRHDPVLAHFQLSLLTEGSGTQIFSTTFVQWAARECLRRAEPSTVMLRFTPRQAQQGMNEMLSGAPVTGVDSAGSLIDAEQGAYYTWLNLQRLPFAESARCLVWHERTGAAVAIGPGLPPGKVSGTPQTMPQALRLLS